MKTSMQLAVEAALRNTVVAAAAAQHPPVAKATQAPRAPWHALGISEEAYDQLRRDADPYYRSNRDSNPYYRTAREQNVYLRDPDENSTLPDSSGAGW